MNVKIVMNNDMTDVDYLNGTKMRKQSDECTQNVIQSRIENVNPAASGCSNNSASTNLNNGVDENNLNCINCANGQAAVHFKNSLENGHRSSGATQMYDCSSSDDDDEQCVYTYKGAEVGSDLPESFINFRMNVLNSHNRTSGCSSPDMDYLEMDFDPGPSNGQDSDSDNGSQVTTKNLVPPTVMAPKELAEAEAMKCDENCNSSQINANVPLSSSFSSQDELDPSQPCCSKSLNVDQRIEESETGSGDEYSVEPLKNEPLKNRTENWFKDLNFIKFSDDSDLEEMTFIPRTILRDSFENQKMDADNLPDVSLLGSDLEDILVSYEDLLPVDPSYSVSAIINVLKLLRIPYSDIDDHEKFIDLLRHKQISENIPLVEYLYMRAVQNANENDLANFSPNVINNKLYSRFFSTYPKLEINILEWLTTWMRKGAVPVITRNIQERGFQSTDNIVRNPWRHNVVYRIESSYVHLANPIERVTEYVLRSQLSQAPLIYVKRKSVLKRWHSKVDLRTLLKANHNRWYNENVLGQVATVIREQNAGSKRTQYVRIPSNCNCGITLFAPSENLSLCKEVENALELPLIQC